MTTLMETARRASFFRLKDEPMDAWLTKWGSLGGGLALLALTAVVLPHGVSSQSELMLGLGLAFVACSSLLFFGVLSRRVHLAYHRGILPWRARIV